MVTVGRIAAGWARRYPDLRARLDRALRLVPQVRAVADCVWVVPSETGHGSYTVTACPERRMSACDCQDSLRGRRCKHRLAAALVWAAHQRA